MAHRNLAFAFPLIFFLMVDIECFSQGKLYTARGYWEESTKTEYRIITEKLSKGDTLTENEKRYAQDYETYLATYFGRMPDADKQDYERLKGLWDKEIVSTVPAVNKEYEWRGRDRFANGLYGLFYGASLVAITGAKGAAAGGIPLITGGLWMLGPAMNPKKYEGLTRSTVRASNTGKILGLGNGAFLGLAIAGSSTENEKLIVGLSSLGSIALGEIGFQLQKKKTFTTSQIEMIRHYGFLAPWIGLAGVVSVSSNSVNAAGAAMLAGGVAGIVIGNSVGKKYDYTRGDVDAVRNLTLISTGIGFTAITGSFNSNNANGLILIPAATSIVGTVLAQRAIKGAHLTDKQGSTLNLSTGGAALVGLGIVILAESSSPAVNIGVPTGLALITHQLLLHNFKMKNMELNLRGSNRGRSHRNFKLALQVTPESYFLNQKISVKEYSPASFSRMQNPLVRLKLTF